MHHPNLATIASHLFRPAYIEVEADGQRYDEMHVDGGVTAQAILYGNAISVSEMRRYIPGADDPEAPKPTVYIIRNAKFAPEHHTVKPKLIPIAEDVIARCRNSKTNHRTSRATSSAPGWATVAPSRRTTICNTLMLTSRRP